MEYQVLIFMGNERLSAIDIGANGKSDRISIDGNDVMKYNSKMQIKEFCQYIKDYYNISKFSDLEMAITILRFDAVMENIFVLLDQIRDAGECNLISIEKVLPWMVLKEGLIKAGTDIQINTFGMVYTVSLGEDMILKCQPGGIKEHSVMFLPEKFSEYNHLNKKSLVDYEEEKNELCKKFDIELDNKEQQIKKLESQLVKEKKKTQKAKDSLAQVRTEIDEIQEEREKNANRYICKLKKRSSGGYGGTKWNGLYGAFGDIAAHMVGDAIKYKVKYNIDNADIVKKNQKIATIQAYFGDERKFDRDTFVTAVADGRVYCLLDSNATIKDGDAVALIGDLSDNREDIMQWYEKNK